MKLKVGIIIRITCFKNSIDLEVRQAARMIFEDFMLFFAFLVKVILLVNDRVQGLLLNDIWASIDNLFILLLVVENLVFG